MNPRPTFPTTAHPREDLQRFVNQLNVRYNVGIPIPDPTLSLGEKKADPTPASRIYRRLEIHFYTGGIQALNGLLGQFDDQAKRFWSSWVQKPDADAETLPTTLRPPLAANLTERDWLQDIFNKILDKSQPSMHSERPFARTRSGPAAIGGDASTGESSRTTSTTSQATSSRSPPKRRANADMGDVTKRTKANADPIRDLTASSSLRRHQAADTSASASASAFGNRRPPVTKVVKTPFVSSDKPARSYVSIATGLSRSCISTTSAPSEVSAVFSACSDVPVGTQDTIPASSQEQRRPQLTHGLASCSQDSYDLTPSLEEGLLESFDHSRMLNVEPAARSRIGSNACSSRSSESTSLPSDVEKEVLHHKSGCQAKSTAQDNGLASVWPLFPRWLREAPFAVAWEVTRIGQSCGVDLTTLDLTYNPTWTQQGDLRASLWRHPAFQGKTFPAQSSADAWAAGVQAAGHYQSPILPSDQQVVYTASLDFARRSTALQLTLQPLKLELSHRLGRHYGSDRFLEVLIPSPDSSNLPNKDTSFSENLIRWLDEEHVFCGRSWKAFYTKSGGSRKPVKDLQFGPEPKPIFKDRIYFFTEYAQEDPQMPSQRLSSMLDWALNIRRKDNGSQPILKLFQRIALVLSRTSPTVVFEPDQITHCETDLLSPIGKVMNDGVARMSPAVARQIRACLGLTSTPSAVQGRLGSAKGMWILDTGMAPSSDEIRIETFPSQRKWVMDWSKADKDHRTLEVRGIASMPKSASFNLQFLPVIEDRAVEKASMREAIGSLLKSNLRDELNGQKRALQTALQFRQWTHENATHKHDRIIHGHVPFLGGMPQEAEETMNMMLDAGFDTSNDHLNKITFEIQKRKCDMLKKKLNIKVGRSVYLYMVVDFSGVLEEDEVHVGFSTAFEADEQWSKTMLHGIDVLVARSPAHFISDIQKVKAVFRPELADLTDAIVFSSKGDIPLADKLSGGDYDGDLAWVCWEPLIVDNFVNAPTQEQPDLSRYMPQDKERFRDLLSKHGKSFSRTVRAMMNLAFKFNLSKSMLGYCTNYKERLCYARNNVRDRPARILSTLLSNLVDQPKQGLRFTPSDFQRLLKDLKVPQHVDDPVYKKAENWPPNVPTVHIIDYLKFEVAKPTVAQELKSFSQALQLADPTPWDEDLASLYKDYAENAKDQSHGTSEKKLLMQLKIDIDSVRAEWDAYMAQGDESFSFAERVKRVYTLWQAIQPHEEAGSGSSNNGKTVHRLLYGGDEHSEWELLKASTAFWMYFKTRPRFVWQIACLQLCWIKARALAKRNPYGAVGAPRVVIPSIYASLRPDAKFVKQVTARMEGGSQFGLDDDGDDDMDEYD